MNVLAGWLIAVAIYFGLSDLSKAIRDAHITVHCTAPAATQPEPAQ